MSPGVTHPVGCVLLYYVLLFCCVALFVDAVSCIGCWVVVFGLLRCIVLCYVALVLLLR